MPKSINSITIVITLEGIAKLKTEKKKWQQNSLRIFLSPTLYENLN